VKKSKKSGLSLQPIYLCLGLVIVAILFSSVSKNKMCAHTTTQFNCVKYKKNYDGDTITVDIPDVHPLLGKDVSIRVRDIDTAERRGKAPCEQEKAVMAKKEVQLILENAHLITLKNFSRGKYFRIVADVYADNKNVKDILIEKRLAVYYDGGTKDVVDWCKL